ncbi:MAG: aminotransferase class I/II-fold pyridoxal phosphate-dependent enzyme [Steroidobacteraceae bacterium]
MRPHRRLEKLDGKFSCTPTTTRQRRRPRRQKPAVEIARYLARAPQAWEQLAGFFQSRRDLLATELRGSGLTVHRAQGTFFQLIDYGALDAGDDLHFANRLINEAKVAVIPLSVFYAEAPPMTLVRLCIAKQESTLREAARRLREFAQRAARHGA